MSDRSFTLDRYSIGTIHIDPLKVTAKGDAFYPRLIVPIYLNNLKPLPLKDKEIAYVIVSAQATLLLDGSSVTEISEAITLSTPVDVNYQRHSDQYQFEFPLDYLRIKHIEEKRRDDANFKCYLRFLVAKYLLDNAVKRQNMIEYESVNETIEICIPQSNWIKKIIPNLGYFDYFIIEMPKRKNIIPKVDILLERADKAFLNWDTKSVFVHCREIGSLLENTLKKHYGKYDFNYCERWSRAYVKFNHHASLDLHLENISGSYVGQVIEIKKNDAELLLINTKALIKYAEELLQDNITK